MQILAFRTVLLCWVTRYMYFAFSNGGRIQWHYCPLIGSDGHLSRLCLELEFQACNSAVSESLSHVTSSKKH